MSKHNQSTRQAARSKKTLAKVESFYEANEEGLRVSKKQTAQLDSTHEEYDRSSRSRLPTQADSDRAVKETNYSSKILNQMMTLTKEPKFGYLATGHMWHMMLPERFCKNENLTKKGAGPTRPASLCNIRNTSYYVRNVPLFAQMCGFLSTLRDQVELGWRIAGTFPCYGCCSILAMFLQQRIGGVLPRAYSTDLPKLLSLSEVLTKGISTHTSKQLICVKDHPYAKHCALYLDFRMYPWLSGSEYTIKSASKLPRWLSANLVPFARANRRLLIEKPLPKLDLTIYPPQRDDKTTPPEPEQTSQEAPCSSTGCSQEIPIFPDDA